MDGSGRPVETPVWREPRAIALLMAASLTVMANATISPALPGLERAFADHPNGEMLTRLLVPAPSLSVVFCAPIAGWAADRFGRRGLLLSGVLLFVIAGTAGLYLPGLSSIFASRLVLGIAVAMIMTAQTALIGDYYAGQRRTSMMGLQVSARNFGGLLFITSAGVLATLSPRLAFAIYGLAGLLLPFIWRTVSEPVRQTGGGQPEGGSEDAGHPAWIAVLMALSLLQLTTNMTFFLMPTQLPFYLDSLGYDAAAMTGAALGVLTLTGGFAALMYGRLKRSVGHAGTFALGYGLMAAGFGSLPLGSSPWTIFLGAALVGAGYATAIPGITAIVLTVAPAGRRGLAGGVLTTAIFLGQFVSPFASIPLISATGFGGTFHTATILLGVMGGVSVILGFGGRRNGAFGPGHRHRP